jgi:DNA-binding transcriptional LysR family regulator
MANNRLEPTECEINAIRAVAEHGTIRAAAKVLFVSENTVNFHIDGLRLKSGRRYLPQIIAWAAARGWLDENPGLAA